jgi:NAD+ synthase (glutamine-hydrolysing)
VEEEVRITLAQINTTVGAIGDNVERVLSVAREVGASTDLVAFPEMTVTGYPPRDLLERPAFIQLARKGLERIVEASADIPNVGIVVGCPVDTGEAEGKRLHNSVFLIEAGKLVFEQAKMLLPTYDVFDEARHFKPAQESNIYKWRGRKLGLSICEDLWFEPDPWNSRRYSVDPIDMQARKGADLFINISASPFSKGKEAARHKLIRNHSVKHGTPFVFVNQVGGNDELVFDGRSIVVDSSGNARAVLPSFEETVVTIDVDDPPPVIDYRYEDELDTVFKALVLGTRDYLRKCGLSKVVIGLSGGIDSAVTAAIAWYAVGAENLVLFSMPSPHTSRESIEDAEALAGRLGARLEVVPITEVMKAYDSALAGVLAKTKKDETEENIQARIRGNFLMAFSNKFGHLPLSTGNKSELAVGYCTLYGDMSGGLAVISDVPKTMVYRLAKRINEKDDLIPQRIIDRPPSAELKPGQLDQDTLPPYDVLDAILERYVDRLVSPDEIIRDGFDADTVGWVTSAVRHNEHKRRQAAPGIKVTSKAFGSGRRVPIAVRYDD